METTIMWYILGLYTDNGEGNGNYHNVVCIGVL